MLWEIYSVGRNEIAFFLGNIIPRSVLEAVDKVDNCTYAGIRTRFARFFSL
jgi:hypothetical protein